MKILPVLNNANQVLTKQPMQKTEQNVPAKTAYALPCAGSFDFQNYFYPPKILAFTGSQKTPLGDEDYAKARKYLEEKTKDKDESSYPISIKAFDSDKLNGFQKGIKVFDGLTVKEIAFMLNKPIILLNRGCNNRCVHCGFNAMPFSNKTLDHMSYEDFKALIDGVKELESRMDNKVQLYSEMGLFLDSDCMEIELKDKDGNVYDCVDCMRLLGDDIEKVTPLFDTSGWSLKSEKHQKRAEKFVDFVLKHKPDELDDINISINPYNRMYANAVKFERQGDIEKAEELKQKYAKRLANAFITFSPLIKNDFSVNILARVIPYDETDTGLDNRAYYLIITRVLGEIQKMLEEDLSGEQKYVQTQEELNGLMAYYDGLFEEFQPRNLFPWGRAQSLFNHDIELVEERMKDFKQVCAFMPHYASNLINPNGSLVLSRMDVSAKTDLDFNFENKGRPVKPFATELDEVQKPLGPKRDGIIDFDGFDGFDGGF